MIAFVAWLWMMTAQGGHITAQSIPCGQGGGINPDVTTPPKWNASPYPQCSDTVLHDCIPPIAPAEHVIEIRTKRTPREIGEDCNFCSDEHGLWGCTLMGCTLPTAKECVKGEEFIPREMDESWGERKVSRTHFYCDKVTKELWIDNRKIGIIREVDVQ